MFVRFYAFKLLSGVSIVAFTLGLLFCLCGVALLGSLPHIFNEVFFPSCWRELVKIMTPYQLWYFFVLQFVLVTVFSLEVLGWPQEILPFSYTGFHLAKYLIKLLELFPSSLELCPINSSHLGFLTLFFLSPQIKKIAGFYLGSSSQHWSCKLLPWVMSCLFPFS